MITTDVVIVGAGLAGIYVALNLPPHLNIIVLSNAKDNSSLAQGGIASCLVQQDSFDAHKEDTLLAGHYVNDLAAVTALVEDGPNHIQNLIDLGVKFDTRDNGEISVTLEGGHSHKRVVHINGDQTGKQLMNSLKLLLAEKKNVRVYKNTTALSLLKESNHIVGVTCANQHQVTQIIADHVVIATGGVGDLFESTTNQRGVVGLGMALADEVGAKIRDMRYIQFHPTGYFDHSRNRYFLISEALRGEGARLVDKNNHRFMTDIDDRLELAPRDVVANAIVDVMRNTEHPCVYLDTRHLSKAFLKERFPNIFVKLLEEGYELGTDLVPVNPVAHYTIGGIVVDLDGRTSLKGLYACGEVTSSGVHGANRLASNSLLECLVYGQRVAHTIADTNSLSSVSHDVLKTPYANMVCVHGSDAADYKRLIQEIMTGHVGIRRDTFSLKQAKAKLEVLLSNLSTIRYERIDFALAYHMCQVALMITKDAMSHDSLGCHQISTKIKGVPSC